MEQKRLNRWIPIFNGLAVLMVTIALLAIFFYLPPERMMGNVQRIFYFHVGVAWTASAAFFVALMGGILYLWGKNPAWDIVSLASVEIGLIFASMTIASGSIWGKPAWNTWWIWSPRLTSITVLWLVYAAYFMLRGAIADPDRRARLSAVYAIGGFVTVIITYYSIRILPDIHPALSGGSQDAQGEQVLTGSMVSVMLYSFLTFSVLYAAWLLNRIRLEYLTLQNNQLKMRLMQRLRG